MHSSRHWQVFKSYIAVQLFLKNPHEDCFCLETWSRYHYNKKRQKFKTILIWRSSRKMQRNKYLLILYLWKKQQTPKAEKRFFFSTFFTEYSKFYLYVSLCEFNCIKIQTMSESASKSIYFSKNSFIAFAFNAKSFAIAILVFFIFFPSRHFFWAECQKAF